MRQLGGVGAEVQFEIEFRQIKVAQGQVIGVVYLFCRQARGAQHFDGLAVLAALEMEISNVVVSLGNQQRHSVLCTKPAGLTVGIHRLREGMQADVAGGHVAEDGGDSFRIFLIQQPAISAFIAGLGIVESVLAVVDVADIDIQPGEPPGIAFGGEDLPRPFRRGGGPVVFAQQKHGLDRSTEGAGHFVTLDRPPRTRRRPVREGQPQPHVHPGHIKHLPSPEERVPGRPYRLSSPAMQSAASASRRAR